MKKRWIIGIMSLLMCGAFLLPACTDPGKGNQGGGNGSETQTPGGIPSGTRETITMYTAVNIIEQHSLEAVAANYENEQQKRGNRISVAIENVTDPDAYNMNMKNMAGNGVKNPTIISIATVPEYHGTDKIVDLAGYLEEPNEYSPDYDTWADSLEPDAYRTVRAGSSTTIPGISYSSNYTCVFYDKAAMKAVLGSDPLVDETGTIKIDDPAFNWDWIMSALETASHHPDFPHPLGLARDTQACGQDSFNLFTSFLNMYLDQYFRDFIETVHSEEGDYSYIPAFDEDWAYDETDLSIDLPSRYTYNFNKVVDYFFNQGEKYGPQSARFKECMENLYDLLQYSGEKESYADMFKNFNRCTLTYEHLGGSYTDLKLFYVETLGYVRTYRDAFGDKGQSIYPSAEQITSRLGWFLMPAMKSDLPGVAKDVRAWGGPLENYGVLSTGSATKDAIAVDFLKYLVSPLGQQRICQQYMEENYAPQVMHQFVKGITIPEEIDFTQVASAVHGDGGSNPYLNFGAGNGLSICNIDGTMDKVSTSVANVLSGYLTGGDRNWTKGVDLLNVYKSGFKDYADHYSLIFTDPANVSAATGGLKNSPYNTTA